MARVFYYALIAGLSFINLDISSATNVCIEQSPCSCKIDEYSFISLSAVHPFEGLFFQDSALLVSYFFSGCEDKDFNPSDYKLVANQSLKAVSLVKCVSTIAFINKTVYTLNQTCTAIGQAKDIQFALLSSRSNDYQINYVKNSSSSSLPSIELACSTHNKTILKIISTDTDALILYSPQVCLQHIEHHELSSGSVFCIIFFVACIIYFFGGAMLMYFARGARGVEVIPNFDFWCSLPGLVRDGTIYVLSGCRPFTVSTAETYDRI